MNETTIIHWNVSDEHLTVEVKIEPFGLVRSYRHCQYDDSNGFGKGWRWFGCAAEKYTAWVSNSAEVLLSNLVLVHPVLGKLASMYAIVPPGVPG